MATTTSQESGGKGSTPSQNSSQTTFSYFGNFAIAFCEGPGVIARLWAGPEKRLIYDVTSGNTGAMLEGGTVRAYAGDETQLADPLIESFEGAGNVPGYRGTVYAVFEQFPLLKDGNRLPFITAEIFSSSEVISTAEYFYYGAVALPSSFAYNPLRGEIWMPQYSTTGPTLRGILRVSEADGSQIGVISLGTTPTDNIQYDPKYRRMYAIVNGSDLGFFSAETAVFTGTADLTGYVVGGPSHGGLVTAGMNTFSAGSRYRVCADGSVWSIVGSPGSSGYLHEIFDENLLAARRFYYLDSAPTAIEFDSDGNVWIRCAETSGVSFRRLNRASQIFDQNIPITGNTQVGQWCFDGDRNSIWYCTQNAGSTYQIKEFDLDTLTTTTTYQVTYSPMALDGRGIIYDSTRRTIWIGNEFNGKIEGVLTASGAVHETIDLSYGAWYMQLVKGHMWVCAGGNGRFEKIFLDYLSPLAVSLKTVVDDLCGRAGLAGSQYITTAFAEIDVDGYAIGKQCSVRAALEPLQQCYFFDAHERDGYVNFVTRGANVMVDIPDGDLNAHVAGEAGGEPLEVTRRMENELPKAISVNYMLEATDYSIATKIAQRLIGSSGDRVSMELPMVISDTKAQEVAEVNLYSAWLQRIGYSFAISKKYAALEPSDVIRIKNHIMRVTDITETPNGILKCLSVADDPSCYNPFVVVTPTPASGKAVQGEVFTNSQLMDIAMLRDEDDDAGFYWAACGIGTGWKGATLFKSTDSGANYTAVATITAGATMGVATSVLGAFTGGNIFDETNTVTITLSNGTLSSAAEIAVLNGANVAVIGSEVVQFKNAVLNADGTYTLSGLLRGRRGTDWAMSTHAVGDRFVLAELSTWRRVAMATSEIGLARLYKVVTFGSTLQSNVETSFTNNAVGIECYSPVQIGGGRNAAGDVTINWVRRTRISGEWRDYVDAALGEASEAYEVEIYSGSGFSTLKRTITGIAAQTTTYTAAQQVTDFGGNQSTIYVKVFQLSATVGRGYESRGSL